MTYLQIFKQIQKQNKLNYCYLGIKKSDFPKWQGWKIIEGHRKNGLKISEIDDPNLDILVENFYLVMFLKDARGLKNDNNE